MSGNGKDFIEAKEWADAVCMADRMFHNDRSSTMLIEHPRPIVEFVTGHRMLFSGPIEIFSQNPPPFVPDPGNDDLSPIDELYGRYIPKDLLIECFINQITADGPRLFNCEARELLTVVRIHEYAHAIVHTGIASGTIEDQLSMISTKGITDWESFRSLRDKAFNSIDNESHELLAQAITWACLCHESMRSHAESLIETFLALESRQPQMYRIPNLVKLRAQSADWRLVLKAARGEVVNSGYLRCMADGLAALIVKTGEPKIGFQDGGSFGPMVAKLQESLASADMDPQERNVNPNKDALLIARKNYIELRVKKEKNHARPHFHIEYKKEFGASYALDSLEPLAGYMPKKYEKVILPLVKECKEELLEQWYQLNDSARIALAADII